MSPISATKSVTSDGWTSLRNVGLVGAEEDPGEEVGGDRGEPEAACRQPEDAEHSDGDGELGERHPRPFFAEAAAALRRSVGAFSRRRRAGGGPRRPA